MSKKRACQQSKHKVPMGIQLFAICRSFFLNQNLKNALKGSFIYLQSLFPSVKMKKDESFVGQSRVFENNAAEYTKKEQLGTMVAYLKF